MKMDHPPEKVTPQKNITNEDKERETQPLFKTHLFEGPNGNRAKEQLVNGESLKYPFLSDEKKEMDQSGTMDKLLNQSGIPISEKEKCSFSLNLKGEKILESMPPKLATVSINCEIVYGGSVKTIQLGQIEVSNGAINFTDSPNLNNFQKRQISTFINLMPMGI